MMNDPAASGTLLRRLWIYQKERFPLGRNGLLILLLAASALCGSTLLRGAGALPSPVRLATAFFLLLAAFLHLRIADEFKDAEADARWRPHRPVPRGLVSLKELTGVALTAAAGQAAATALLAPAVWPLLLAAWAYTGLMTAEFGASGWLRRRPAMYLLSHMGIMPLLVALAAACDWRMAGASPPPGIGAWLGLGFANGVVLELGRKTWAPESEREGVESYSSIWGIGPSTALWLAATGIGGLCTLAAERLTGGSGALTLLLVPLGAGMAVTAQRFARAPTPALAARMQSQSALYILANLVLTGPILLGVRLWT